MDESVPGNGARQPPLHEFWWLHDARWYQGVMRRFGQEAANEINAEAIRHVFRRIARWYRREHGLNFADMPIDEFVAWFDGIPKVSWPDGMMTAEHTATGEDEYESVITKNYSLRMLAAARALDGYECPCPNMRAGWFDGMEVQVLDTRDSCVRSGGDVCRFRAVIQRPGNSSCDNLRQTDLIGPPKPAQSTGGASPPV